MARKDPNKVDPSRRRALAILGLTAAAAYTVPALATLKSAHAKDGMSTPSADSPAHSPSSSGMDSPQDSLANADSIDE